MLAIQLEDRALFLERWRKLLLDELAVVVRRRARNSATRRHELDRPRIAGLGRLSARQGIPPAVRRRVMTSLTAPALDVDPTFDYTRLLRGEGPVWQIIAERPMHLLDPKYKTWDDAILDTSMRVIAQLTEGGKTSPIARGAKPIAPRSGIRSPRDSVLRHVSEHARRSAARRCLHAARQHAAHRTVRANGRLTRSRKRRHPAHADRPERPSASPHLWRSVPRLAHRRTDAVSSGPPSHTLVLTPRQ
jgi:penicillin amidase